MFHNSIHNLVSRYRLLLPIFSILIIFVMNKTLKTDSPKLPLELNNQRSKSFSFVSLEKENKAQVEAMEDKDEANISHQNFINYELRTDQTRQQMFQIQSNPAFVCAPNWVEKVLEVLMSNINVSELHVYGEPGTGIFQTKNTSSSTPLPLFEVVPLSKFSELVQLQVLSRNEGSNTNGRIKTKLYTTAIRDEATILSLKDLVRQTVIVSEGRTTHYGGYRVPFHKQDSEVYICDLAALQFQQEVNSGRLVLVRETPLKSGILDDLIFTNVVGETKKSYQVASQDPKRFVKYDSRTFGSVLFDTVAYKRFVAQDVVLAGLALNHVAGMKLKNINFKFLKYGTGYFAGSFGRILDTYILEGVLDGLETLFEGSKNLRIKTVQLPFYKATRELQNKMLSLEGKHDIKIRIVEEDALKQSDDLFLTATTNCGDPHAVFGNEMGYGSVDAAIAENLDGKGHQFCPLMNHHMNEIFFPIKCPV